MMYKFRFLVFMMLFATTLFGQYSRTGAIDLVLNTVLADDVGNVDVYCSFDTKTMPVDLIDNDTRPNPFSESWVFFSNDNPFASWYHSSRVIFVSAVDGAYTVADVEIYPKGLSSDYEEISMASRPAPIAMDGNAFVPNPEKVLSNYNYALIIVSMDEYRNWYNTSLIYNVLLQNYNYQKDNITVLYSWDGHSYLPDVNGDDLDGDFVEDDIDGPATYASIQTTITNLTNALGHGDQLAVFFTGVPVQTSGPSVKMGFPIDANKIGLYDVSSISQAIDHIDCGQMVFNFDVNSSTEVMSYFEAVGNANALCQNRYLTGSSGSGENNYAEMYFSGGDYSEQLFYWASAARGYLPDVYGQAPWNIWEEFGQLGLENGGGDYGTYIPGHPGDSYRDDDGDGYIQMDEAFNYADSMNTWTSGYCHLPVIGDVPSISPIQTDEFPFNDNVLNLSGLIGNLSGDQTFPSRSYVFAPLEFGPYSFSIKESKTQIDNNVELYLHLSTLDFTQGVTDFIFGDNISIIGEYPIASGINITCNNFAIGNNSIINKPTLHLKILNPVFMSNVSFFDNFMTFIGSAIECKYCYFDHSHFHTYGLNIAFLNSDFFHSGLTMANYVAHTLQSLIVDSCIFNGYDNQAFGYFLWLDNNTGNVHITNSTFDDGAIAAYINNTGYQSLNEIRNNTITNMSISALQLKTSRFIIEENKISDIDGRGIDLWGTNEIQIIGNKEALSVNQTQSIINCSSNEVMSWSEKSFPTEIKWNAIIDDDNQQENDALVYCSMPPGINKLDVRYNYWGLAFNALQDLYPPYRYIWDPVFELNNDSYAISDAEAAYNQGNLELEQGDYTTAQNTFKQVVSLYPETKYANASLKALMAVEHHTQDFATLKAYYQTEPVLLAYSCLHALADILANRCVLQLENYPEAITWFEDRIQNPPSFADSIYAIIDLGNTYLVMENSTSKASAYVGSMPWYKPVSPKVHRDTTRYLLSLFKTCHDKPLQNKIPLGDKPAALGQNLPNPFNTNTIINYALKSDALVTINIFSATGSLVETIENGNKTAGNHSVIFNAKNLPHGIYFYSIQVYGATIDSKKMMLVK